ncbi:hypothetical protein I6H88_04985 [Elizabethkingia bruuniana]|uniref:Uncharacterized protein n=1 Tax=Elizabethkingia bruuniana TaxID=1756149 RepID=A0A7T7V143_9FLAO|nr:hypothetical protein [Elizabethkingia bruuniana]KGO11174.1 hypothetical protein KS04_05630 [Elizabethkingia miricola]AQX86412.1 hypothetical protein AYC65_16000 [Elizabethkingia bruuniana]KUY24923.1 hypothetical protein ATB97_10330 [Elizabethkingia bruuniana]OPB61978.1 hypothetical protein BAY12_13315 [Elizabethkingia bruuniana]QDZ64312.1 hypothetical protein EVD20_20030 [Elizabethkingia bruuniana]
MNILERKQIQKYLEDKRLPLDIYLEIEDHIISQIEELEHEGIGFQEAFLQVKTKWKKELSFQNFSFSDVKAVPKIVAKIRSAYVREIMPKILIISFLILLVLVLGAYQLDIESFKTFYTIIYAGFIILPVIVFILNFEVLIQRGNYNKRPLNAYHKMVELAVGMFIFPMVNITNVSKSSEMFYSVFYVSETSLLSKILTLSMPLYFSAVCLFSAFVFIKYKREVTKMKLA